MLLRSNYLQPYDLILGKIIIIMFALMAVQFYCFMSTFFASGYGRWRLFAYSSLALIIVLVICFMPKEIVNVGDKSYPVYGEALLLMMVLLLVLAARGFYVFARMLKVLENPVLYSQIVSLILGLGALTLFGVAAALPFGREYPVSHLGNLINAFVLSYAVIRHRLVDIRLVLRRGSALVSLGIIGILIFWILFALLSAMMGLQFDLTAMVVGTVLGVIVIIFAFRLRGFFFEAVGRAFQGSSYEYRQKLSDYANTVQNVFSLKEQGGELLALLTRAIGIKQACLLFPEASSEDFHAQFAEPKGRYNHMSELRLKGSNPVVKYLGRERKPLTRENLVILPEFLSLWEQEREEIKSKEIELFMPLISRDRLIAILALGKKQSGRYSLDDLHLLEDVTGRVAVSMEKEYLREQLREREEELSVINRSSVFWLCPLR